MIAGGRSGDDIKLIKLLQNATMVSCAVSLRNKFSNFNIKFELSFAMMSFSMSFLVIISIDRLIP